MKPSANPPAKGLNPYQKNRLGVSLLHVDRLLRDVEQVLAEPSSRSPFRRYVADVTPEQQGVIAQSIEEIRRSLVETLRRQDVPSPDRKISALHAIRTNLDYADIYIAELAPRYMQGYGRVEQAAAQELNHIVRELGTLVRRLYLYLGKTQQD
jgi:hypothetical protein